jgi:hypothetical protein
MTQGVDVHPQGSHAEEVSAAGLQTANRVEHFLREYYTKIATEPRNWAQRAPDMQDLQPWYVSRIGDSYTVTVPSDLESFADDPGVCAAIAACGCLGAEIKIGLPMNDQPELWVRNHPECDQYFYGLAAALRVGTVLKFPGYSGWFGKGYNLIMRARLTDEGYRPWLLRGTTMPMRKVFSHKKWGDNLPSGWKHFEVLTRAASRHLKLSEEVTSWAVPLEALKGTRIKKGLLSEKIGFLQQVDVDALHQRFKTQIDDYHLFSARYKDLSADSLKGLETILNQINSGIKQAEMVSDSIINHRASVLYPGKETARNKRRRPLKSRIAELDIETFVNVMGPWKAIGIAPFALTVEMGQNGLPLQSSPELLQQFEGYIARHADWQDLLRSWWTTEVQQRF